MMRIVWIFPSILLVFASGCAPSAADAPSEPQAPPAEETSAPAISASTSQGDVPEMTPTTPAAAGRQTLIEKAFADLAQRLSIPITQIKLMEVREVIWPDASMGCPQPDMAYTQVPVDGLLIRLGVGKKMYLYHSGGTMEPFLCESASPIFSESTPKDDEFVPPPDSEID
jgi:hypothetical protein